MISPWAKWFFHLSSMIWYIRKAAYRVKHFSSRLETERSCLFPEIQIDSCRHETYAIIRNRPCGIPPAATPAMISPGKKQSIKLHDQQLP